MLPLGIGWDEYYFWGPEDSLRMEDVLFIHAATVLTDACYEPWWWELDIFN